MAVRRASLSIDVSGSEGAPHEVRLLRAGRNTSARGDFVLDDAAVRDVLTAWDEHAAELDHPGMVDLEHLSLDPKQPHFDPDSRAWFVLEARDAEKPAPGASKDLWLSSMKWTADGARRLSEKTQRFLSPVVLYDGDSRRVQRLINVALTALPALDNAPQLVAARLSAAGEMTMADGTDSAAQMGAVLKALGLDPRMVDKVAIALGLEAGATLDDIRAALDAFAAKMQKVEELINGDAPADAAPSEEPKPDAAPSEEPKPDAAPAAMRVDASDATALRTEIAELRAFRETVEAKERRELVASMVKLGAEAPATAWSDDAGSAPAEPWASMRLEALRARVAKLSKREAPVPPRSGGAVLDERRAAIAKEYGLDPADYAARLAAHGVM